MVLTTLVDSQQCHFDLSVGVDISIPITETDPANAFHLPPATFTPFAAGDFIGSVEQGGPVRCDVVQLAPHGNGTHTECVGHIAGKGHSLLNALTSQVMPASLITVALYERTNAITRKALEGAWQGSDAPALVIRTTPNDRSKKHRTWSGNNPPHLEPDAMKLIVERGVQHLLIDLPSVDPEEDEGKLIAHHIFWQYPNDPRTSATITELIYVPDEVADGLYALDINAAAFDGDAAPSRPYLHPQMIVRNEADR